MGELTLLIAIPALGAILVALLPRYAVRPVAILTAAITMLAVWWLLPAFDSSIATLQFAEMLPWNPRLGTYYALGLDGFSYPMVLLETLLSFIAIVASSSIRENIKGYYLLMLLLEAAMLGVFMAQDWSLFYLFWELTLIPLFFLIGRWGGKKRNQASLNFVLYTMGGSIFILISLLVLFDSIPGHSFAMADMTLGAKSLPREAQVWIFLGFLIGFGVKMPIFPLHGWLPLAHVEAPSPVSILLSGILLKMGSYGLIRAATMLPEAIISLQGILAALALFSLIYGGLLAWRQTDLKMMVAYSSISHMGIVLLGIAALNTAGLTGAIMQMVSHGFVAGILFLLIGLLYERTGSRDINHYSSLVQVTPRFAFFTSLAFVGAVGMPGTAGFIAELHAIIGGFERWGWSIVIISIGVMISAAYAIRTVGKLLTGPVRPEMQKIKDLNRMEMLSVSTLAAGIIIIGVFPASILHFINASVTELSNMFSGYPL